MTLATCHKEESLVQVEAGLEVSFQPTADIADQTDRFLPVGWGGVSVHRYPWPRAK